MNIDRLQLNKEYKNKSEVCKLLEVKKASGGRNIKYQDEEFARYFKLEKTNGYKVIVTEIYPEPLAKIDKRKGNSEKSEGSRNNYDGIYAKNIDAILIDYFAKLDKDKIIFLTTNQLAKEVGLVNQNYSCASRNASKYINHSFNEVKGEINFTSMWDTFTSIKGIKRTISSSLLRLVKGGYITYKDTYMLAFNYFSRGATDIENEMIKEIEVEVLGCMKTTKQLLQFNYKLKNKYYQDVEKLVIERIDEVDSIYIAYEISIISEIHSELSIESLKKQRLELNGICSDRIKAGLVKKKSDSLTNSKNKKKKGNYIGKRKPPENWELDILKSNYLTYADYIIDSLIRLEYKNITREIENTK